MTTAEQATRRAAFYADLRSGERNQGIGALRRTREDGTVEHCCLGVGMERYVSDPTITPDVVLHGDNFVSVGTPNGPRYVALSRGAEQYYGFNSSDPYIREDVDYDTTSAATWNDGRNKDFAFIADAFEYTFPAVADE